MKKHPNDRKLSDLNIDSNIVKNFEPYEPQWINLKDILPKSQPWLWDKVIPLETSTLLAGYGGIGKSTFLLFLAAHVSNGLSFNCCGESISLPQGNVILIAAEDREDTTLVPNLLANGANLENIEYIKSTVGKISKKSKFLELDKELHILEQKIIERKNVKLIIIDPVSYFSGNTKDHIQTEVANLIQEFNDLARKNNIAIIFSKHLRKKSGKQTVSSIVDEVGGSGAWVNTPRQSFAFMSHPVDKEKILMFNLKVNIAKKTSKAFCYTIQEKEIEMNGTIIKATKLAWSDHYENIGIDEAVNIETFDNSKACQAQNIIYDYLKKNGVTSIEKLRDECKKNDISTRTCQRAYLYLEKEGSIKRAKDNIKPHFELVDGWDNGK